MHKLKKLFLRYGVPVEILAFLLLCALITVTTESQAEDTKLYVTTRSIHYQDNGRYNNNNYGVYVEFSGGYYDQC